MVVLRPRKSTAHAKSFCAQRVATQLASPDRRRPLSVSARGLALGARRSQPPRATRNQCAFAFSREPAAFLPAWPESAKPIATDDDNDLGGETSTGAPSCWNEAC